MTNDKIPKFENINTRSVDEENIDTETEEASRYEAMTDNYGHKLNTIQKSYRNTVYNRFSPQKSKRVSVGDIDIRHFEKMTNEKEWFKDI